jgi:hypothetical protein
MEGDNMKTSFRRAVVVSAIAGLGIAALPVWAHHTASMFDSVKIVQLTGTITEVRWTNPHVNVMVNAALTTGGKPAPWLMEMTSPGNLTRNGWSKTALKPGDKVVLDINPLKDDSANGGRLVKATLVDSGQVYTTNYKELEAEGRY